MGSNCSKSLEVHYGASIHKVKVSPKDKISDLVQIMKMQELVLPGSDFYVTCRGVQETASTPLFDLIERNVKVRIRRVHKAQPSEEAAVSKRDAVQLSLPSYGLRTATGVTHFSGFGETMVMPPKLDAADRLVSTNTNSVAGEVVHKKRLLNPHDGLNDDPSIFLPRKKLFTQKSNADGSDVDVALMDRKLPPMDDSPKVPKRCRVSFVFTLFLHLLWPHIVASCSIHRRHLTTVCPLQTLASKRYDASRTTTTVIE